jgi:hypothetical protein
MALEAHITSDSISAKEALCCKPGMIDSQKHHKKFLGDGRARADAILENLRRMQCIATVKGQTWTECRLTYSSLQIIALLGKFFLRRIPWHRWLFKHLHKVVGANRPIKHGLAHLKLRPANKYLQVLRYLKPPMTSPEFPHKLPMQVVDVLEGFGLQITSRRLYAETHHESDL